MAKERQIPTATEIELIIGNMWDYRQNLIVCNVSHGMGLHECDVLILSGAGYATEVEIKVSKADLKKDSLKGHGHNSKLIKYLYFAVPEFLSDCIEYIPQRAGIISINRFEGTVGFYGRTVRQAEANPDAIKWDDRLRMKLMRLACMRIWNLKSAVQNMVNTNKLLKQKLKINEHTNQTI